MFAPPDTHTAGYTCVQYTSSDYVHVEPFIHAAPPHPCTCTSHYLQLRGAWEYIVCLSQLHADHAYPHPRLRRDPIPHHVSRRVSPCARKFVSHLAPDAIDFSVGKKLAILVEFERGWHA